VVSLWRRLGPEAARHVAVVGVLLAMSLAACWRLVVAGHPTTSVLCQCGDPGQTVWFLEWVPWALGHGHNPFFTDAIFAGQGGANLLQSTSYLLPAFVLSPVTVAFGPTAALNVALVAGPVLSGWCMFLAARRVTSFFPGQLAAAVLWGFSPLLVSNEMFGHLNFTFLFFPPLLFCVLHELVTGTGRAAVAGGLGGLLVAAQFLTGTEALAITALVTVVGCVVAVALFPRAASAVRRRLLVGLGAAAAVCAVLLAYPVAFFLAGPRHVTGQPWPATSLFGEYVRAIVTAEPVTPSSLELARVGGYYGTPGPGVAFLGLPLLVGLLVSAAVWRRRRLAVVLVVAGGFAWLCSFGALLLPLSGHSAQWWLPWRYLQHWPLLGSIGPDRFALMVDFAAALLVALSLDGWAELARRLHRRLSGRSRALAAAGVATVAAVAALGLSLAAEPLVSTSGLPLRTRDASVPAFFADAHAHLRPSNVVLVYPYPSSGVPDAMYWQAAEGLGYRLVGGRALVPGRDGVHSIHVDPLRGFDALLVETSFGYGIPPAPSRRALAAARRSLLRWGVDDLVVVRRGRAPDWMAAVATDLLGTAPRLEDGTFVWDSVRSDPPPLGVSPAVVERCAGSGLGRASFRAAPGCVLRAARSAAP